MLTKNNTSSELTRKRQTRMQFANYIQQRLTQSQGCLRTITIEGGSGGTKMASIFTDIKEGAAYTTPEEQALILASGACPTTTTTTAVAAVPVVPNGEAQWAFSTYATGGPTTYNASSIDGNGNLYVGGEYSGGGTTKLNIISYAGISNQTITESIWGKLPARSIATAFLIKYDSTGTPKWGTYAPSATSSTRIQNLVSDANGNTYALMNITGVTTLYSYTSGGGNGGDLTVTSYGTVTPNASDCILVKYNTSGAIQWVAQVSSSGTGVNETSDGTSRNIALDSNGNVCFSIVSTTTSSGSVVFNSADSAFSGGGGAISFTSYGSFTGAANTICVCKVNSSGAFQKVAKLVVGLFPILTVTVDSNDNVYFASTVANNSGTSKVTISSDNGVDGSSILQFTTWGSFTTIGAYDVVIVKFNSSLAAQAATRIAGTEADSYVYTPTMTVDSANNVYVATRYYEGTGPTKVNIYSSSGTDPAGSTITFTAWGSVPSSATSGSEVLLAKFSSSLICSAATYVSGSIDGVSPATYQVYMNSIITDSNNNVYIGGYFTGTTFYIYNFSSGGGGAGVNITTTTFGTFSNSYTGNNDAVLIKFNSSLTAQWAVQLNTAAPAAGYNESVTSVSVDSTNGYVYAVGTFLGDNVIAGLKINNYGGVSGGSITQNLYATLSDSISSATKTSEGFVIKYTL